MKITDLDNVRKDFEYYDRKIEELQAKLKNLCGRALGESDKWILYEIKETIEQSIPEYEEFR